MLGWDWDDWDSYFEFWCRVLGTRKSLYNRAAGRLNYKEQIRIWI